MCEMESRVGLITCASQRLSRALAERLAAAGWSRVVDARRADRLEWAVAQLPAATRVVAIAGYVTDPRHRDDLVGAVRREGRLDLLVNNASTLGVSPLPALAEIEPRVLHRIYDVNVVAPI